MEENKNQNMTSLKRQRDEEEQHHQEGDDVIKKQKSYKDIITLLEEEDYEPSEDISSLISTLQEELSSTGSAGSAGSVTGSSGEEEEEGERVMRHLLEASDDELGIPSNGTDGSDSTLDGHVDGGDLLLPVGDCGLWEFEDFEAANYYNNLLLLQSEVLL